MNNEQVEEKSPRSCPPFVMYENKKELDNYLNFFSLRIFFISGRCLQGLAWQENLAKASPSRICTTVTEIK